MKQQHLITLLLALLLLFPTPLALGQVKSDHQAQIDFSKLEEVILAELKETNTPGAAIGVVKGDRLIFAKGFGVSNTETGAPVTPEMLFRLASVTKMFTAAALVTQVEKGKLKLDEPIGKYAKGLDARIAQLTANQLLSHTSGLQDFTQVRATEPDRRGKFGLYDDSVLGEYVRAIKADWLFTEPGRIYSYSNPGYVIAGYVIEEVSGKHYADQMDESLFKPLGMKTTTLRPTMAMTWPLSQGHDDMGGRPKVIRPMFDNAGFRPGGFIFSSVADLSRFVIAFMNGGQIQGQQAILPEVIKRLSTPHASIPGSEYKYGYGLRIGQSRGIRVFGHGGNMDGFGSDIIMAPDHRVAIIILANKSRGHLPKSIEKAMELTLPLAAKANENSKTPPLAASEIERFVGRYGFTETIFEVLFDDGKLLLKGRGQSSPMSKISETRFTVTRVGPQWELFFVIGANGNVEFLHINGRSYKKLPTSIDQGSAQNERAEEPTDLALKEVQSAAEAFIKAFNNLDWDQFRNCFADDATMFFPSATMAAARTNGRTEIEAIFKTLFEAARKRKDSPPYLNIEPKDTRIRVSGNAAVVTFHLGGKVSLGRRTVMFEKQKGRWLIVHLHASTMAISNSKFVGTWKLVAIEGQQVPKRDWAGLLIYDATGHMAAQVIALDRPKFASDSRLQATKDETKAAFDGYAAYFGPYEVNEAEGVVIHHVKGSNFPNEVGMDNIRYYEFSGDRLTLIPTNMVDGKLTPKSSAAIRLIWERVK